MRTCIFFGVWMMGIMGCWGQSVRTYPIIPAISSLSLSGINQSKGYPFVGAVASIHNREAGLGFNPALISGEKRVAGGYITGILDETSRRDSFMIEAGGLISLGKKHTFGIRQTISFKQQIPVRNARGDQIFIRNNSTETITHLVYGFQIAEKVALGVGVSYLYSDFGAKWEGDYRPIRSTSGNIGLVYRDKERISNKLMLKWDLGTSFSNLGPKVSYSPSDSIKKFIHSSLQLGLLLGLDFELGQSTHLEFGVSGQLSKLLLPIELHTYYDQPLSSFDAMTKSFTPRWLMISFQLAYEVRVVHGDFSFIFRNSFFNQHSILSNYFYRDFVNIGFGVEIKGFRLDYSFMEHFSLSDFKQKHGKSPLPYRNAFALSYTKELK